jgi:TPR repeat protein
MNLDLIIIIGLILLRFLIYLYYMKDNDYNENINVLYKSAIQGHRKSQYNLGGYYYEQMNIKEAIYWY